MRGAAVNRGAVADGAKVTVVGLREQELQEALDVGGVHTAVVVCIGVQEITVGKRRPVLVAELRAMAAAA